MGKTFCGGVKQIPPLKKRDVKKSTKSKSKKKGNA